MSGHSKWHSIKHKKGAADAKRGKVFTMHAKLIAIAARSGGDPEMNPGLRTAIDRAKGDNVPNANIDRAVKKGSGTDKDAAAYVELTYEAIGPDGSAFMIDCVTDNTNRTLTNVRTIVTKNGGSMGSVSWQFEKKAYLLVDPAGMDKGKAEMELIDCGADDLVESESENGDFRFALFAPGDQLGLVRKAVEDKGMKVEKDELIWKAKEEKVVSEVELAQRLMKFMDKIDEDDDVNQVYSNLDFSEEVLSQL